MQIVRSYRPSRAGDLIGYTRKGRPIYLAGGGSPDHDTTATPEADDAYAFPFPVPADLSTVTDDELRGLLEQVRDHSQQVAADGPRNEQTVAALQACRDLAAAAAAEVTTRREADAATAEATAALDADLEAAFAGLDERQADAPEGEGEGPGDAGDGEEAPADDTTSGEGNPAPTPAGAVVAARRPAPSLRRLAGRTPPPQVPATADRRRYGSMTAAADVPGFAAGQVLNSFAEAAQAVRERLERYPNMTAGRARRAQQHRQRPITAQNPATGDRLVMTTFSRHSAVQLRREFPDDLRIDDTSNALAVVEHATAERRLPGGSLVASAQQQVKQGRSLTAAAGWCAPSEVLYDLVELETMEGLLDLPEVQASRGGFQIPVNGGPDFTTIWDGIGNAGDTHLTEAEVIADTAKVCMDIPCPDFEDIRLGVDYVCLTGSLLQRRGYPEMVNRFTRGAFVALAHKVNRELIAQMVADSGPANIIPAEANGEDAISGILAAVDLALTDIRYRNRMGFGATAEVVLPMWVLAQIRAAATRRRGVDMVSTTDAQIMGWFAQRGAVPRFVYDWQDAFSGLGTGPGGATALKVLPKAVQFLVYPAGTWIKAVQDVISLDTIYDSTKLATNEYTAVFAEDGWAALQMGPTTRLYTAQVDPAGVVGCCDIPIS